MRLHVCLASLVGLVLGFAAGCGGGSPQSSVSVTLASSAASLAPGASVSLSAKLTRSTGKIPAGALTFYSDGQSLGTAAVTGGAAALDATYAQLGAAGAHSLTATFLPPDNGGVSNSNSVAEFNEYPTAAVLRLSNDSIQQDRGTTLEVQVQRSGSSGTPSGTVTFTSAGAQVGTATLSNGIGYLALPVFSATGQSSYTAQYSGDTEDAASAVSNVATVTVTAGVDVLTHHINITRDGLQSHETQFTPANVNSTTFGLLRTFPLDGTPYAQPLYVSQYTMADGLPHNVVLEASAVGSVFAFDADGNNPAAGYLWKTSLVPNGEAVALGASLACGDAPLMTVIGTPVIDRARGVLYVVSTTTSNSATVYTQRLHALKLADGTETMGGPQVITATYPGKAADAVNGTITFNALAQNQRPALLEAEGSIWIAYASHCDKSAYHGWVLGYDPDNVTRQTSVWMDTPNGSQGGIWMSGGGPSADSMGNIYAVAGNGTFDANEKGADYGDSVLKLAVPFGAPSNSTLTVADYFTPSNQATLDSDDWDMGTADAMLFTDPNGKAPNLLATADKTGTLFLINRDNMGKYRTGSNGVDGLNGDVTDFTTNGWLFEEFAYLNNQLYEGSNGQPLAAYTLTPGTATSDASLSATPGQQGPFSLPSAYPAGGTHPVISANGSSNAIVWAVLMTPPTQQLYAFDANNLSTILYSTQQNPSRDTMDASLKLAHAVVADGHVFVVSASAVHVFGLIPAQ